VELRFVEFVAYRSFHSSRPGSYIETRGLTGGPEVVKPYTTSRGLMSRSS
jgi:hypothetical protein